MRHFLILLTALLILHSCKVNEKPILVEVKNIDVRQTNSRRIVLSADALFINPNAIGGELKTDAIKIYVNDREIGFVSSKSFKVPAKKEFSVPLTARIPLDSLINKNIIRGLIGSLFSKTITVNYKGDIIYKALGFSYSYKVDETQNIKIKL